MPGQAAGIIETIANREGIDLQHASFEDQLYVYALTFLEIQHWLEGGLHDFPEETLEKIVNALNSIFITFNRLLSQKMEKATYNDIMVARNHLKGAISSANAATMMLSSIMTNSKEFYQFYSIYQSHLLDCCIYIVDINNQVSAWLQPE
jgi:hypothetical protein